VLSGTVPVVPGLPGAEWLVVAAPVASVDHQHLVPVDSPGVRVTPLACLDGTRPCAELELDDVVVPDDHVLRGAGADADADGQRAVDAVLQLALVQLVAQSVGTMRRLFDMTLEYAKARVAFGRPIGSFQAVKHLLADLSMVIELSSAIADEAAQALQARGPDAAELASVAKAYVGEAGIQVSQGCLQVHGGIGYTWDHDLHLYLRRLAADATLFGDPAWHRERLWHLDGLVEVAPA
jgi:alkylation response protein AidB-like acyl-CoA dehydrogenase